MKLISHRGYIIGKELNPATFKYKGNSLSQIQKALDAGFDVEIDLNYPMGPLVAAKTGLFLCHDSDEQMNYVEEEWIEERKNSLWIHAKDKEALLLARDYGWNVFYHDKDNYTMTSDGYIWAHPNAPLCEDSIVAIPEDAIREKVAIPINKSCIEIYYDKLVAANVYGICSDFVQLYKDHMDKLPKNPNP